MQQASPEAIHANRPAGLAVQIAGLGTAVPITSYTQNEILDSILKQTNLKPSTRALYRRVFSHPSIQTRHFALTSLDDAFDSNPDRVNQRFEQEGAKLGTQALLSALKNSGLRSIDLDFLVVATCTGYICPGFAPHLIEKAGLNPRIRYADLVGMGCGGALPALEQAANFTRANPGSTAAVVCIEICSAAFFSSDDSDIVISNALFSDGAAALIITSHLETTSDLNGPTIKDIESFINPSWREELRFQSQNGRLKNVLGINVPRHAAEALRNITGTILRSNGLQPSDVSHWMIHPGGHAILQEAQAILELNEDQYSASRTVLSQHGNMSSASVLFVLQETMAHRSPQPGEWGILCSFGAGFSAFAALVRF